MDVVGVDGAAVVVVVVVDVVANHVDIWMRFSLESKTHFLFLAVGEMFCSSTCFRLQIHFHKLKITVGIFSSLCRI